MTADARRARRLIAGSRLALWTERAWRASWRGLCLAGAGAALALFDVWSVLPPGPRIVALSAWMIAVVALFWIDWAKVFWPSREAGIRHLEDANALPHRPISAAEDALASGRGDAVTEALWRRHLDVQAAYFAGLKAAWPKSDLAARDPYAVRGVVFIGLAAGLLVAGGDAPRRLGALFNVESDRIAATSGIALDAWITPPPYTGLAPIILSQAKGSMPLDRERVLSVPVGSKLTLRLDGQNAPTVERLPLDGAANPAAAEAGKPTQAGGAQEITLAASERIRVFDGGRKAGDWEITVLPDAPPSIAFDGEIDATPRLATHISFAGGDDYGVAKAEAHITLAPEAEEGRDPTAEDGSEELIVPLPLGSDAKAVKSALFEDLTAHPWAGLPVVVQLSATDAADQAGLSEEKHFTLPEREFHNPLAKAIVEQRRNLSRGPAAIPNVALALDALTLAPEMFGMKTPIYLGVRSAYWQLMASRVHKDVTEVQALLWDIALTIEDGGVTASAERVRELQKQLQQALKDGASDEEIQRLTQQLREAMRQMMETLAQNAPESEAPLDPETAMSEDDLNQMLDRIEEMSKLGAKDAAEQLLSQMQQMIEGLDGPMAKPSEKEKQLAKTLAALNDIIRQQQALRDQTYRAGQQQDDPASATSPEQQKRLADQQKQLSERVKKLENDLKNPPKAEPGKPDEQAQGQPQPDKGGQPAAPDDPSDKPSNLSDAGHAMEQAEGSIRQSNEDAAVAAQDEALAKLKSDQDAAKQALAQEQKKSGGVRVGRAGGRRPGMDPAGRPDSNGNIDNGSVKIPTERETQRARDILNELRKRSGESTRPQDELNYLDRLLRRF